jgi:3-hydroxybutyryl-CoA dehydratase
MTDIPQALRIGAKASYTKTITDEDVVNFARFSGDDQPVHLNSEYAANTRFERRIVHGAILVSMVSTVLGHVMAEPDHTIIFLGQQSRFVSPAYLDDTVTVTCEVTGVREDKPVVTMSCTATNQDGVVLMTGETTAFVDPHPYV